MRGGGRKEGKREWKGSVKTCAPLTVVKDAYDYMGRSYLHIPQDEDVDLRSDEPPDRCYAPKKLIHEW